MEYQSPAVIERGVLEILRKLNVLYPEQITELLPGSESGILKAIKRLEKQHQLYRNPYTVLLLRFRSRYSIWAVSSVGFSESSISLPHW